MPPRNAHLVRHPTDASKLLHSARLQARLQLRQVAAVFDVHPRTVARWETGRTKPSTDEWIKLVAYFARFVPETALELAKAADVPSPFLAPPPVDFRAIEDAFLHAADLLDVSPRRIRAAVRNIANAVVGAHGTLADLAHAAQEKLPVQGVDS